jgi:membrane-bound metal-dependent hydrolase YbcI (DUF457 family)
MRGLTHVIFGIGFVSAILSYLNLAFPLWIIGSLIISPVFSRIPDYDQKVAKITFNYIVPHRGKHSHNLLYGIPVIAAFFIIGSPILVLLLVSVFGALFAHTLVDIFNSAGVWLGIFKISVGNLRWDSFFGNFFFKLIGIILLIISILPYM